MELKLLWVECGRYSQEKEDDPNAIQVFSGCVELCCMPSRAQSRGLPVMSYTARKKSTGWSAAALCELISHKCPYRHVAAFVGQWSEYFLTVTSCRGQQQASFSDTKPTCPTRGPKKCSVAEENLQDKSTLCVGF